MIDLALLPRLNATLNGIAAVLLVSGFIAIRRRRVTLHKTLMLSAFVVSTLFLASYVTYHVLKQQATGEAHTRFPGTGPLRTTYLVILVSHVILAVVNLPLVIVTMVRALRGRIDRHRRIARWTLPIWIYVSVTGVVVYWMLYHLAVME